MVEETARPEGVAWRAAGLGNMLKGLALCSLSAHSLTGSGWHTGLQVAEGIGQNEPLAGRAQRHGLLHALAKWSGAGSRGWPPAWRLLSRRQYGKLYWYKLTPRGWRWLREGLPWTEARQGLAPGAIMAEVTGNLGLRIIFPTLQDGVRQRWAIAAPFTPEDMELDSLGHIRTVSLVSVPVKSTSAVFSLLEDRLGLPVDSELRRRVLAAGWLGARYTDASRKKPRSGGSGMTAFH